MKAGDLEERPLKFGQALSFIGIIALVALLCGCGQTYELVSIEISPSHPNVVGIGGMKQIAVLARYSNTKTTDVTHRSTYTITAPTGTTLIVPPTAVTISPAGMLEVVQGACTWTKSGTTEEPIYGTTPYTLKASFDHQEAIGFVSVASIAGCEFEKPK
jgi:hypothetical protein